MKKGKWVDYTVKSGIVLKPSKQNNKLLKDVFNIDTNNQEDLKYLSYLRGNKSPVEMLQKQKYEFVCFVNPPSLDDVFSIAEGGEVMPQKSTYFFPKVYSGLVTRCF